MIGSYKETAVFVRTNFFFLFEEYLNLFGTWEYNPKNKFIC